MTTLRLAQRPSRAARLLLAVIAYVPALLTAPGRMPADTKLYLYLNPGRLISDAPYSWDTRQFGGWVPHQVIEYLWPQGPWYWVLGHLGAPDWVAHRLWIGTLLFLGAWGVHWAARLLGLDRGGALAAAVVYQLSPYVLPYLSRTSAMLLPWAAVGWLVGLTIRSATSGHRWRHPAVMALVLVTCAGVNATATMMIAPAPVLWLIHASLQRTITWRRAIASAARIGALAMLVSVWWIVELRTQSRYGANVLGLSESLQATSFTSTATEALRGMGYWLFYVRDPYAFTTTAAQTYMESAKAIALSIGIVVLCLGGLACTRWAQRRYAALLVLCGIVLAVGVHPIDHSSPLMSSFAQNSRSSVSLAIRSSARALPLSNLGLALGLGALVTAIGASRLRWRVLAPGLVVVLAVANLPALFSGGLVDPALARAQDPPAAWQQAAAALSSTSSEYRVMQLPGSEFGAFRWGYTVDPPLPGMTTKPLITRDLLPLGSPGVMDLLYALDDRVQTGTLEPASVAPVARFLGADTLWVANDLAFERFRTPRPSQFAAALRDAAGLTAPVSYGAPSVNVPVIPMIDEHALSATDVALPPVQLQKVTSPASIVRASDRVVVLVGSGDGIVDASAVGLLHGDEALIYAADATHLPAGTGSTPALTIVTDSNRARAHHWRSSKDVSGFTETGTAITDVLRPDEADQRLPVFGAVPDPADETIATLDGGLVVRASGYGEPFAYRPEQRPAMAVDGDPTTAWVVGDRQNPVGEYLEVSATQGSLTLLQPPDTNANRRITSVRITGASIATPLDVALDERSLRAPGQHVALPTSGAIRITISGVGARAGGTDTGPSAVGFAELGVGAHVEVVRVPKFDTGAGPLAVVLTRLRSDPLNRWRSDPETRLVRSFDTAGARSFDATITLHLNSRADDRTLNGLNGASGPVANRRLTGDPNARGLYASDGDPSTAWTSPFGDVLGSELQFQLDGPVGTIALQQPTDQLHSIITAVRITGASGSQDVSVPSPDGDGRSTLNLDRPVNGPTLTLTVTSIQARTTIDRRFAEPTTLPVAVREMSGNGLVRTDLASGDLAPTCATGLLTIDGHDVPVAYDTSTMTALAAGGSVDVHLCPGTTLSLAAGTHRLETASASHAAFQVDRVTLTSGVAAFGATATPNPPPTGPTVSVTRTRTSRTATVSACPRGCWLIMGEGFNVGWTASSGGHDLGAPVQIAGGFNGWWLPPSAASRVVDIGWTAQRPVTLGLIISAVGVLLCVFLVLQRRPARRRVVALADGPPRWAGSIPARTSWTSSATAAVVLVVVSTLIGSPKLGVLALVPAVVILLTRRPRLAAWGAAGLMAAIGARIALLEHSHHYLANAAWPSIFQRLHQPSLLVVALLLASALTSTDDADGSVAPRSSSEPVHANPANERPSAIPPPR